ncbi:MAG: hypothetical protein K2X91_13765 [Thermoleophilia bacterium]|nr:hypothetical protein [Thermoleophilia bacterium]
MSNDYAPREGPPAARLERWLDQVLRGGGLKALPKYAPPSFPAGHCPERFARELLTGLRESEADRRRLERLKDDGRAFRSWAETALLCVADPPRARFAS